MSVTHSTVATGANDPTKQVSKDGWNADHAGVIDDTMHGARGSGLHTDAHSNANDPTAGQKAALAGTSGAPGAGNAFVTDADARNTNSRTPLAHVLDGALHTASGLTIGHVLKATGAAAFAFGQLLHSQLGSIGANDHHNQAHPDSDHTDAPILKAIVDVKGDLIAATAADAVARLAAGADDTILMADAAAATGLKWVASASPSTQAFADAAATGTGDTFTRGDHKHAMPTLGYGLSGNSAPAVGLSQLSAFLATAVSISAATYADLTGASVSLAAGTWLIVANVFGSAANLAFLMHAAITDGANAVVAEGSQFVPASGTASVHAWGHIGLCAIVSPGSTTTYKLRAARGLTTLTNTFTAQDGAGTNTANNASDNTDKGTGIFAIRIA